MPNSVLTQLKALRDGVAQELRMDPRYRTLQALDKSIAEITTVLTSAGLLPPPPPSSSLTSRLSGLGPSLDALAEPSVALGDTPTTTTIQPTPTKPLAASAPAAQAYTPVTTAPQVETQAPGKAEASPTPGFKDGTVGAPQPVVPKAKASILKPAAGIAAALLVAGGVAEVIHEHEKQAEAKHKAVEHEAEGSEQEDERDASEHDTEEAELLSEVDTAAPDHAPATGAHHAAAAPHRDEDDAESLDPDQEADSEETEDEAPVHEAHAPHAAAVHPEAEADTDEAETDDGDMDDGDAHAAEAVEKPVPAHGHDTADADEMPHDAARDDEKVAAHAVHALKRPGAADAEPEDAEHADAEAGEAESTPAGEEAESPDATHAADKDDAVIPKGKASGYVPMAAKDGAPKYTPSIAVKFGKLPNKVDLRPLMTPIEDQGQTSSCVANAVAGAYEYWIKKASKKDQNISRLFVYYNARWRDNSQDKDEGSVIQLAMEGLQKFGACSESVWPFDPRIILKKPGAEAYQDGAPYRVHDMAQVPLKLETWKQALAEGKPIIFGIELFDSFDTCTKRGGVVPMPAPDDLTRKKHSGHSMCAVGYNESEKVFIIRNSWGTDFGDKGYCYMPFDYILSSKFNDGDCWVFVPKVPSQPPRETWQDSTTPVTNGGQGVDFVIVPYSIRDYETVAVDFFAHVRRPWNPVVVAEYGDYVSAVSKSMFSELETFDVRTFLETTAILAGVGVTAAYLSESSSSSSVSSTESVSTTSESSEATSLMSSESESSEEDSESDTEDAEESEDTAEADEDADAEGEDAEAEAEADEPEDADTEEDGDDATDNEDAKDGATEAETEADDDDAATDEDEDDAAGDDDAADEDDEPADEDEPEGDDAEEDEPEEADDAEEADADEDSGEAEDGGGDEE